MVWDVTPCGLADEYQRNFYHDGSRDFSEILEPIYKNTRSHIRPLAWLLRFRSALKNRQHSWPKACSDSSLWIIQRRHTELSKTKPKFSKRDFFFFCIDKFMRTNIPRRYTFILSNGQSGVPIPIGIRLFVFSKTSRSAQGPTQLPIQLV